MDKASSKPARGRTPEPAELAAESPSAYAVASSLPLRSANRQDDGSRLRVMIARGLGVDDVPDDGSELAELVMSGRCVPALPYDLTFPEVFYPDGVPYGRQGFDAVLGNPPWDRMLPADKEFFASFEFAILDAPTKREREAIQTRLTSDPAVKQAHDEYIQGFRGAERIVDTLYEHQIAIIDGEKTIGKQDLFRLFMERKAGLLSPAGWVGVVVPSAFHANEGATAIRRLYLDKMAMRCCYSFENRRKLFEIHSSFKFALVVAQAGRPTSEFACAFYLHDDEWLFGERGGRQPLRYTHEFVCRTGGEHMSLLELQSTADWEVAETCFANGDLFGRVSGHLGIRLGRQLNMTDDSWRFKPTSEVLPEHKDPRSPEVTARLVKMGYLVLHEGKTFRQYDDHWGERPRYLVRIQDLKGRPSWLSDVSHFRVTYREIAGPGDENVSIWTLLPPGCVCGHKAPTERTSPNRKTSSALWILGIANSSIYDWLLAQRVRASVSAFMRDSLPIPHFGNSCCLIPHQVLRLTCNHSGYAPLWREQLGDEWREPGTPPFTWPVLADDDERWAVRAAIDAVVADAYGLSREQYAHVLSTFSHASYRRAPELCLARFDELKQLGLDKFTRKYDPYWDIPLNENLPQPVIDLPIPGDDDSAPPSEASVEAHLADDGVYRLTAAPKAKRGRRKR